MKDSLYNQMMGVGNRIIDTNHIVNGQAYSTYVQPNPTEQLKQSCIEIYKSSLWYNIKTHGKDVFTEQQHKNMLSMLESNDKDTLELLRQILVSKIID